MRREGQTAFGSSLPQEWLRQGTAEQAAGGFLHTWMPMRNKLPLTCMLVCPPIGVLPLLPKV